MSLDLEISSDEEEYEQSVLKDLPSTNEISTTLKKNRQESEQEVLKLLFFLAERCTSSQSYTHHGVSCDYCGMSPIRGTRHHCVECPDVDICEGCEMNKSHNKFHSLLKIRVPIPLNLSPKIFIYSKVNTMCFNQLPKSPPYHIVQRLSSELQG